MKKTTLINILLIFLIASIFISSNVFAENEKLDTEIRPMASAQKVIDYTVTKQQSKWFGEWKNVKKTTYYKNLYPPVGYRYIYDHERPNYSDIYYLSPITRERIYTVTYHYKLVKL